MPIIQKNHYSTLTDGIADLREKGYDHDFDQAEFHLECKKLKKNFKPENFTITHTYRFEGMTNPSDNSVLYGIEADDGTKGILIDAYGVYADAISPEMIEKFRVEYKSVDEE
ncbi:phosphoribosylpyrophosphate synthetase [Neolewinella aurantiaca]|nr:phosphoribosylpyrophosphate synthetase [Neolewinella aurantiaca]